MCAKSVLVIGAGITGVATAEWLRRDGCDVTLIDRVLPGDPEQASYGNAGLLARGSVVPVATPSLVRKAPKMIFDPASPLFLRWSYLPRLMPWLLPFLRNTTATRMREISEQLATLTFDTNDQHLALSKGTPAAAHIARGEFANLYPDKKDYDKDLLSIEIRARFGPEPRFLTRADILERDPHIGPAYTFGTVLDDYAWITSPAGYVAALFDHFRSQGGQFRQGRVVDVKPGPHPMVTLEGGEAIRADKVVLSAGAWSGRIAKTFGAKINLETERGYHVSMHRPSFKPPHPYMITDAKFVLTPMAGALRAAGVVEFGGVDAPPSRAPAALIEKGIKRVYPTLEFEKMETWMGRRPTMPDSLPAVGESANAPNILHAYGGQHIGLTIGPKLGRMVADMVAGRTSNVDLSPFKPDRF